MDSETNAEKQAGGRDIAEQRLTPPLNAAIIAALFTAEVQEKRLARKVIGLQTIAMLVAAGVTAVCWESSPQYAIGVLIGGGISVFNGALLAWRMSRASHSSHDAHQQLTIMYFYAAERFLAVVAMLGISLAVLKLSPLAILSGFVLGQTVLLAARLLMKIKIEDSD